MVENTLEVRVKREEKKEELKSRYRDNFLPCEHVFPSNNAIPEHLGETDAENGWKKNKVGAYKQFLTINAYQRFIQEENLILVGRTGTGKSTILNRYKYAVDNGEIDGFSFTLAIKFERVFNLLKTFSFEDESITCDYIMDVIDLIVKLSIIQKIAFHCNNNERNCNKIREVLKNYKIGKRTEIVEYICRLIDENCNKNSSLKDVFTSLKSLYKEFENDEVLDEIDAYLQDGKIAVLADSLDYYDITEQRIIIINRALVELAFKYYSNISENRVLMKVAIPSEVYKYIFERIAARRQNKVVMIEWSYKDIIKMLAIRILYFFDKNNFNFAKDYIKGYKIEDFYSYNVAKEFLNQIFPEKCHSCINTLFNTMSYCIRHTQKKPRQVLKIFNSLIDKICEEKQLTFFKESEWEICNYVHKAQEAIIKDALSMYATSAKNKVLNIVNYVLEGKKNFLNAREFNNAISGAISVCKENELDIDIVKQIIIESGLVGQVFEEHFVEENSEYFENSNVLKICIAIFEYQSKQVLSQRNNTIYVLHPMCYEFYNNSIDYNALVYPTPAGDRDDDIIEQLREKCVIY